MKVILMKIFVVIFLMGSSLSIFSQNSIKFGYHDDAGNIKNINEVKLKYQYNLSRLVNEKSNLDSSMMDISPLLDRDIISFANLDTVIISVLLPFYIPKNDTLQKYLIQNQKDTNEIYKKSELGINFLEGILLSVDSLSSLGVPIVLHVFDTENNIDTVRRIIKSDELKKSHVIFGPIYFKNFNLVRNAFRFNQNKILINPLSSNEKLLRSSPNVKFLTPSKRQHLDSIVKYLSQEESSKKIIFITHKDEEQKSDYYILRNRLISSFEDISLKEYESLSDIKKNSFQFLSDKDNIVFILSKNKAFIKKIVTFCGASDSIITVYANEELRNISELNIETLMKLKLRLPISNYIDKTSPIYKKLCEDFERKFYHQMDNHSYLAFKSILHFCYNVPQFNFIQSSGGGDINTDIRMCVYNDYKLIPIR